MFSKASLSTALATGAAARGGDPSTELEFLRREGNVLSPRGGGERLSRRRRGGERDGERESYDADLARRRGGERERLRLRLRAGEGESRPPFLRGGDGERE